MLVLHVTQREQHVCIFCLNIAGAVIFGTGAFILFMLRPALAAHNITSVEISLFHTFFNIICTTVMMPFGGLLVKLSGMIIREKSQDEENGIT